MHCASRTTWGREVLVAVAGSLMIAGCTSSTAPKPVDSGLWVANFAAAQTVVQYKTAQLAASTSGAPSVAIGTGVGRDMGVAFDGNGNLWVSTFSNATIQEYTAAQLKTSATPTPSATITLTGAEPAGLAFDSHGNLWVASYTANTILEFSSSQLSSGGVSSPAITLGGMSGPVGIAFDAGGSLWVANTGANTLAKYTSSQLTSSGSPTPAVTITANAGSIVGPLFIAFDASGALWVANGNNGQNTVVSFSAAQLASSGSPVPAVTLSAIAGSLSNPGGLAFDGNGNLWVGNVGSSSNVVNSPPASSCEREPDPQHRVERHVAHRTVRPGVLAARFGSAHQVASCHRPPARITPSRGTTAARRIGRVRPTAHRFDIRSDGQGRLSGRCAQPESGPPNRPLSRLMGLAHVGHRPPDSPIASSGRGMGIIPVPGPVAVVARRGPPF